MVKGHPHPQQMGGNYKKTGTMTRDTERVNIFGVNYGNEVSGPGAWGLGGNMAPHLGTH